ncbi:MULTISPECIES: thiamine-binding protein [unclassified Rossellomorea]|uniref:thiamine-binding protein n=1 Tax=unclassified Rossellomorea TaxID=2837526 RepID=UPI00263274C7|nr:thiamine-binding protein [uncultured Rossellomorea sp.]
MPTLTVGFQTMPNGKDVDTNGIIPKMIEVVKESGLTYEVGPMETVVEGEYDKIMSVIKESQEVGIQHGATEVFTNIKMHYKSDGVSIADKKKDV